MTPSQQSEPSWLHSALLAVRRHTAVVLVCLLGVPIVVLAYSLSQTKQYSASATLLFREPSFSENFGNQPIFPASSDPTRDASTNFGLVALPGVAVQTARALTVPPNLVSGHISLQPQGQSNLLSVTVTETDPRLAARVANELCRQYIQGRQIADRSIIQHAVTRLRQQFNSLSPAQRTTPRGLQLTNSLNQLSTLAALQTGNAELAQQAVPPSSPSSPRTVRNTALGLVVGAILGLGLALLLNFLDQRLRTPEDLTELFEAPLLAAVPRSAALKEISSDATKPLPMRERDPFSTLRTNLQFLNHAGSLRSLLVTSAVSGEGKTTVSLNLASAAAAAGAQVLLVEADLRRPSLRELLGLPRHPGFSNVLAGQVSSQEAVLMGPSPWSLNGAVPAATLHVLAAGDAPPNPADLLASGRLRDVLKYAEETVDIVIFDSAPIGLVPDPVPLASQVDGVVLVARPGAYSRKVATRVRHHLVQVGANLVGVVANAVTHTDDYYGIGYGYYDRKADESDDRSPASFTHFHEGADVPEEREPHAHD